SQARRDHTTVLYPGQTYCSHFGRTVPRPIRMSNATRRWIDAATGVERGSRRRDDAKGGDAMNTDLTMLAASAVLTGLLVSGKGLAMWMYWPVADVLGNRDDPPPLPAWAWRADRAHRNMLENFPHFAHLVLLTNMARLANPLTPPG